VPSADPSSTTTTSATWDSRSAERMARAMVPEAFFAAMMTQTVAGDVIHTSINPFPERSAQAAPIQAAG
jgi:hypothetical protein